MYSFKNTTGQSGSYRNQKRFFFLQPSLSSPVVSTQDGLQSGPQLHEGRELRPGVFLLLLPIPRPALPLIPLSLCFPTTITTVVVSGRVGGVGPPPTRPGGGVRRPGCEVGGEACRGGGGGGVARGRGVAGAGSLGEEAGEAGEQVHVSEELLHVRQVLQQGGQPGAGQRGGGVEQVELDGGGTGGSLYVDVIYLVPASFDIIIEYFLVLRLIQHCWTTIKYYNMYSILEY